MGRFYLSRSRLIAQSPALIHHQTLVFSNWALKMMLSTNRLAAGLAALTLLASGAAMAEERRQLDSHEHGVTTLNIALEEGLLVMELEGPAMNFVGFEHDPRTDEQKAAIADAIAILRDGATLFELTTAAECSLRETDAEHDTDDDHSDHDEHADHDDHDDHEDHSDHDEHADHDDHDDHEDHADHSDGEQHSEFEAEYAYECSRADELTQISVRLFERFPLTNEVEASFVGDSFQTFRKLTPSDPVLKLEP